MRLAVHLFLLVMSLCFSGTSVASNCITKTFTNVKDNSWSEVTWVNAVSGTFEVTLTETADHFGAYGKDGKRFMKVRVNGTWKDLIPSTADKTAYRGKPALTDTVDITENITGISLRTPTWTKTTGGGTIKVCNLGRWVNPAEVVNWTKKPGCQYQPGSGKLQGVANTIDNDENTFWNAHPCREPSWFLLFDMKTEQELTAVQMRSAGNGNHDPRKFALDWCPDASGNNCRSILAKCKRDIDDQKVTPKNASYQSCDFKLTKKRYLKISMNAWGKSGSRWYEGGGARWQYSIRDVQFKRPGVALEKEAMKSENAAPSIKDVRIRPMKPTINDTLTCAAVGYSDPDGDTAANTFAWKKGGSIIGTRATLSSGFAKGDVITCEVTPHDGIDAGTPISTSITIENTPETGSTEGETYGESRMKCVDPSPFLFVRDNHIACHNCDVSKGEVYEPLGQECRKMCSDNAPIYDTSTKACRLRNKSDCPRGFVLMAGGEKGLTRAGYMGCQVNVKSPRNANYNPPNFSSPTANWPGREHTWE